LASTLDVAAAPTKQSALTILQMLGAASLPTRE
jgi:hypothetical protein